MVITLHGWRRGPPIILGGIDETGKVVIGHRSVEFCEATPIGLADESKKSLYGRETDRDLRTADLRSA